ncbi:hypothetical protein phiPA13_14 [Pseudomonas phage phiPA1-3]|uniref:Uncharacterized protein n=1 Tax=Pseudomonas phage DL64 TaxID=1640973 RepID=A0A0F6WDP5_9CAUD|nr:hypothetical protein AVU25_gp72 [Pseudomonas phage DL64]AKF14042.1 hypothetical protein [Pseudomonas phage DL64]QWT71768.1 hypothetical protein [Pseudomonas phage vB_Pae-PA14]WJY90792.1 hypothetical protein phiPA13_14 [Pseudomonas phage phiPA1-3]
MPTALEMLMSGTVSGREVTATGLAERTPTGRLVQDRDYLTELLEVHKYRGRHIDVVMVDMTELEERVMAHMLDQIPVVQKKVRRPKWEMPLRNHETNHLGKGPRNKFGGFN